MRKLCLLGCALLLASPAVLGQTLTQAEREFALQHLEETRRALVQATAGLSEEQWNFKPAPERWSVAEIVEHLALSEDVLRTLVVEKVLPGPALSEPRPNVKEIDAQVLAFLADRSRKFQAAEPVRPTGRFGPGPKALESFRESRGRTLDFLRTARGLRAHAIDFSPLGVQLDAYQWLLFVSGHTVRHTKQLEEVKADPNFPKE